MSDHILIVDDDPSIRRLIRRILEKEGYRVSVAGDGETALALLEGTAIALLITDKNLPGLSGFDLVLRARELIPDLPAVMMTGFPEPMLAPNARLQGYLAKPFDDLKQITFTIRRALEMRRLVVSMKERNDKTPTPIALPHPAKPKG